MQFVADLEPVEDGGLQIMYGIDGRRDLTESTRDDLSGYDGARPVRIGNGAFDQRQNDVYGAVLDSILLHTRRSQRLPRRAVADRPVAGRVRHRGLAAARPGHLGGPRRSAALRVVQAHVLGGVRPGRRAGRDPRGRRGPGDVAGDRRRDPRRHPRARADRRRRAAPALRHRRARRVDLAGRHLRLPPGDDPRLRASRPRHRRRPDRARLRAALPDRRDRRRACPGRRGRSSSARSGSCPRSPSSARSRVPAT